MAYSTFFDKAPFFNKSLKNFRLSSINQKLNLLNNIGVDFIVTKKFDQSNENSYFKEFRTFYGTWQMNKYIGGGIKNFRYYCHHRENIDRKSKFVCNMHPHNYYLQMLGETGIIGLIFGSIMIISIIWFCFVTGMRGRANVLAATAFIVPLGLFFPIQTTADFFGQWNNIFMWSAIALALATRNLVASDGTTSKER